MDIPVGGDRIALLTYSSVEVIDATSYDVVASAPIPDQPQAESLTLSLDEKSLLVGSEGKKSTVYSVPVPSEPRPRRRPGSDPGSETDVPEEEANALQSQQRGTLLALGLAAFVALVAGHCCRLGLEIRKAPNPDARRGRGRRAIPHCCADDSGGAN